MKRAQLWSDGWFFCKAGADVSYEQADPAGWKFEPVDLRQKIHIKGFSFTCYEKAWMSLKALEADAIYGDSFTRGQDAVEEIGNNVSLVYTDMDVGERQMKGIIIRGRAVKGNNTIHVRFFDGREERKQIVEFDACGGYEERSFPLEPLKGRWEVNLVFMPGSCFDLQWFRFF